MDDKDRKVEADAAEFSTESGWRIGGDSDNVYFFGNDRDSSILSDFGWNLHPHTAEHSGGELDRIGSEILAGNCDSAGVSGGAEAEVEPSARQGGPVSTSSSDDPPEKSSASVGDSVAKPSSDTAFKVKKKGEKRIKQPRFAFMTKSEVDHLEDGYRWRKYGQKAVKNSPFPRSYYRCTNSKCTVKKRVERSCEDPTIVITTYEGQHCHHSVGFPRGGALINHEAAFPNHLAPSASRFSYPIVSFPQESSLENLQSHQVPGRESGTSGFLPEPTPQPPIAEGLLGDIVPGMRNRRI